MSVERYYNEVITKSATNGYGPMVKSFVQALLEADNGVFTLAQTDTDTTNAYTCWLRVYDTNIYLNIYNSTATLKADWYCGLNGRKLSVVSTSSVLTNGAPYSVRATVSKMGDFGVTVTFGQSYNNNGLVFRFAKFVSDIDGLEYNLVSSSGAAVGITGHVCASPFVTGVAVCASGDYGVSYTATGNQMADAEIYAATKSTHFLVPHGTILYNTNGYWLGHVKWGGKYDMYQLRGNEGASQTVPTANYVVNGVTYKAAFSELLIPVECT